LPITLMTFAIFTRSDMVVTTGWPQVAATMLVLISTCGIAFAMFGRFTQRSASDLPLRIGLALVSLLVMFYPDDTWATAAAVIATPATAFGIWRHRRIASPAALAETGGDEPPPAPSDSELFNEAKRDFG
jgi:uncharacterized membrane protein